MPNTNTQEEQDRLRRLVTVADLENSLKDVPSRFEVRFLIVVGLLATQFVPIQEVAQAAIRSIP